MVNQLPFIIGLKKLKNLPPLFLIFVFLHLHSWFLFSKDIITFAISFISLFVRKIPFVIFLTVVLSQCLYFLILFLSLFCIHIIYLFWIWTHHWIKHSHWRKWIPYISKLIRKKSSWRHHFWQLRFENFTLDDEPFAKPLI